MKRMIVAVMALFLLSGCAEVELASHYAKKAFPGNQQVANSPSKGTFKVGSPYKVKGKTYYPQESYDLVETGIASWYGPGFDGKQTANGEIFNMNELTAAHKTLQMPSLVRVTNLENGRSLIVRVNDRGPYKRGRIIDLSKKSADLLGFRAQGTAKVKLEVLKRESLQVAQAAKNGVNTRGFELALNNGRQLPQDRPVSYQQRPYQIASAGPIPGPPVSAAPPPAVTRETLITPPEQRGQFQTAIPGHTRDGQFYPDPIVSERPVTDSNIYVQAGSFSVYDNAARLSQSLSRYAKAEVQPATINGRQYYRVRLGPVPTVARADSILASVMDSGNPDAMIVVD